MARVVRAPQDSIVDGRNGGTCPRIETTPGVPHLGSAQRFACRGRATKAPCCGRNLRLRKPGTVIATPARKRGTQPPRLSFARLERASLYNLDVRVRLFLTAWIVFSLHYATDFVREHFLVVSMVEDRTFDLEPYLGMHPDIFSSPPNAAVKGVHHGANPGISMLAAIPYVFARPFVDRIVARQLAVRRARNDTSAVYNDPRAARVQFYRAAVERGLDVRFGLVGVITMVLCMAPLSAFGVVVMFTLLRGAGLQEKTSAWLSMLYAFGTPVLFRTAYLNQNLAIGVVALTALLLLWNPSNVVRIRPQRRLVLAGLAGGFAFLCDYSGALATGLLGLYAMARGRDADSSFGGPWRAALGYGLGAAVPLVVLWYYQWAAFGNFILPPQHWMPAAQALSEHGYQGITGPSWELFQMLLLHPQFGLFVFAPLLILALGAPFVAARRQSFVPNRELLLCGLIGFAFILFFSTVQYTRLQWSTGIRYLMPIVPFLFVAAAVTLVRLPKWVAWPVVVVALTVSWSIAMVRNQYGVSTNVIRVFVEGLQLPWLSTLGRMAKQYAPWLDGRPSALPAMLLTAVLVAGIWLIKRPRQALVAAPLATAERDS